MAFCRLVLSLLVLSVLQCYASVHVPVFLWGDLKIASTKFNPLSTVSVVKFDEILQKELKNDPFTVIFIEETLSVEDLSGKNSDGDSSYPYLQSHLGDSVYLPNVENPLRVLNKLADPLKVDHVKLTENGLSSEIESADDASGKFLFINLKDAKEGESRSDLLRRHNDFMQETFDSLQEKYGNVVAVYTGHFPSWTVTHSRVRRQAELAAQATNFSLPGLLIYYNQILLEDASNSLFLSGMSGNSQTLNGTEQSNTLEFVNDNITLTLNFYSKAGYWFFDTVTLTQNTITEELKPEQDVFAFDTFAYRCGQNVSFSTVNETRSYKLTFQDLKLQPFFTTNATGNIYGDSYNCIGFFSVPIWSGLFVVFILLSITFYGIMMMMDIRTMDRFDDPKGKTITINAE